MAIERAEVEALAELIEPVGAPCASCRATAERILTSDWLAVREAKARAEGANRWEQLAWDAIRVLGFDTDGDPTPAARVGWGTGEEFMRLIHEAREDSDETLTQSGAKRLIMGQHEHQPDGTCIVCRTPWPCATVEILERRP